ncbi:MAG: hypothetical protein ACOYMG_06805, partial [Candidatus Methylumidiphilus sp.]
MELQNLSPNTLLTLTALTGFVLGCAIAAFISLRRIQALKIALAVAMEKIARIPELESQLKGKSTQNEDLQREQAGLTVQLTEQRKSMDEKLALLQQAEVQLTERFE